MTLTLAILCPNLCLHVMCRTSLTPKILRGCCSRILVSRCVVCSHLRSRFGWCALTHNTTNTQWLLRTTAFVLVYSVVDRASFEESTHRCAHLHTHATH
jgi:hypothetical protein